MINILLIGVYSLRNKHQLFGKILFGRTSFVFYNEYIIANKTDYMMTFWLTQTVLYVSLSLSLAIPIKSLN